MMYSLLHIGCFTKIAEHYAVGIYMKKYSKVSLLIFTDIIY